MALVLPMFAASVHVTNVNLNVTASWRGADKYRTHPPDGGESGRFDASKPLICLAPQPAGWPRCHPAEPNGPQWLVVHLINTMELS